MDTDPDNGPAATREGDAAPTQTHTTENQQPQANDDQKPLADKSSRRKSAVTFADEKSQSETAINPATASDTTANLQANDDKKTLVDAKSQSKAAASVNPVPLGYITLKPTTKDHPILHIENNVGKDTELGITPAVNDIPLEFTEIKTPVSPKGPKENNYAGFRQSKIPLTSRGNSKTPLSDNRGLSRQHDENNDPDIYYPHLAIYDHLPKNVDIFSDSKKYQSWARTILPRISASQGNAPGSTPGFVVKTANSTQNTGRSMRGSNQSSRSIKSEQGSSCPRTYNLTPEVVRFRKHNRDKTSLVSASLEPFLPQKRKVKPGLARGTVCKPNGWVQSDSRESFTHRSSTSNYTNEDSLSEYNNADVSSEYFTGFSFQQAFTAMAATGGIKPAYRGGAIRRGKPPTLPPRQKTYVSISLPALQNAETLLTSPSFVSATYAHVPYHTTRRLGDLPTQKVRRKVNPKNNTIVSSLSQGMVLDKQGKTIPTLHEMTRSQEEFTPNVSAIKA